MTPQSILLHLDEPAALEARFREDPAAFAEAFAVAWDDRPTDPVLRTWHARLDADGALAAYEGRPAPVPVGGWAWAEALPLAQVRALLAWAVGLIVLGGLWLKVPDLIGMNDYGAPGYDYERSPAFHARFAPFYALLPLLGLFALRYRPDRRALVAAGAAVAVLLAVQAARPMAGLPGAAQDLAWLSAIHLPTLLLSLGGAVALGRRWHETGARTAYLQLVGESAALGALFLIGGVVLVGITAALFGAIGVSVEVWLFEWVVPFGLLGVLPIGALMAGLRPESGRVAPLVARVFGPLALAVLAVYLPTLLVSGALNDRETLLTLNVALIGVLALVILIEAERPDGPRHWTDGVGAGLVALALAADLTAFAFVAGRLAENGLTPNRLAVVGLNALVAIHLAGLVGPLVRRALRGGGAPSEAWTARFLGVYAAWGAVVVLVFPLLFWGSIS